MTTVRAAPGLAKADVVFSTLDVNDSNNLTFQTFTCSSCNDIGNASLGGAAHNITYRDFVARSSLCIEATSNGPLNILLDGGYFGALGQSCTEGRLGINGRNPLTPYTIDQNIVIRNTEIDGTGGGASDGFQSTGGTHGYTLGPGNYVHGIDEANCGGVHCDGAQLYAASDVTVTGNYFQGNSTGIVDFDNSLRGIVSATDNVVSGIGTWGLDLADNNALIAHNTVVGNSVAVHSNGPAVSGAVVRDNAAPGGVDCTSGCTKTNNPTAVTFVGGPDPAAWDGFELTSPLGTATDGGNVGARRVCAPLAC